MKKDLKKEDTAEILFLSKKVGNSDNRRKKIEFYKKLFTFVSKEKKAKFFEYIKEEIKKLDEKNNIKEKITKQKEVLEKRVEKYSNLKKKYEKKTNILLKNVISKKIVEKIDAIEKTKSFKNLATKRKIFLYETFLEKINERKKNFLKNYDIEY